MENQEITCKITGKVQMVMFRDFVQRHARSLGIRGTVENLDDGSVEVVAQGSEDKLKKLIEHLHKGPFLARVLRVDTRWREPSGEFDSFSILY
ncbi:MAG: acylphosphatase [Candidatus Pacebacteria bacterium]|nr:acylphosphatase [Candidatus Paceibacterota bacterium]